MVIEQAVKDCRGALRVLERSPKHNGALPSGLRPSRGSNTAPSGANGGRIHLLPKPDLGIVLSSVSQIESNPTHSSGADRAQPMALTQGGVHDDLNVEIGGVQEGRAHILMLRESTFRLNSQD